MSGYTIVNVHSDAAALAKAIKDALTETNTQKVIQAWLDVAINATKITSGVAELAANNPTWARWVGNSAALTAIGASAYKIRDDLQSPAGFDKVKAGSDKLYGEEGDDVVLGQDGNDMHSGRAGAGTWYGVRFQFNPPAANTAGTTGPMMVDGRHIATKDIAIKSIRTRPRGQFGPQSYAGKQRRRHGRPRQPGLQGVSLS